MEMLIRVIANSRKDTQVRVAGMVDEPRRARHELAVYEERWPSETVVEGIGVRELVEGEEVHVLLLRNSREGSAAIRFLRRNCLAYVSVDKLTLLDVDRRSYA